VTAQVNGDSFVYPSLGNVEWLQVGPDMAPGVFRIPMADTFQITFAMVARSPDPRFPERANFVSQEIVVVGRQQLPYAGIYRVYTTNRGTRSASVGAEIRFRLATQPN
jgi:hypothetical protein